MNIELINTPEDSFPYLISDLIKEKKLRNNTLIIASNAENANLIHEHLDFLNEESAILLPWDCNLYDFLSPSASNSLRRVKNLLKIIQDKTSIIIATDRSAMQKFLPLKIIKKLESKLKQDDETTKESIIQTLNDYGYQETEISRVCGDFSVGRSIIDVVVDNDAIRINLFNNKIFSMKLFDVYTQKTYKDVEKISILPVTEIISSLIKKESVEFSRGHYLEDIDKSNKRHLGAENWLAALYNNELQTIFDILKIENIVFTGTNLENILNIYDDIHSLYTEKQRDDLSYSDPAKLFSDKEETLRNIENKKLFTLDANNSSAYSKINFSENDVEPNIKKINAFKRVAICCKSIGRMHVLQNILQDKCNEVKKFHNISDGINLTVQNIKDGFVKNDLCVISDKYFFYKKDNKIKRATNTIDIDNELEIGNPVVHRDYGIGIFNGFKKISIHNIKHDCIEISYGGSGKILLPVENIRLITNYPAKENLKLDTLRASNWKIKKNKAKNHIKIIADELIRVAVLRKKSSTTDIHKLDKNYIEFSKQFQYTETEEQLNAIHDVEQDFKTGKLMDRLICGDTGFGKTEVAIRAAFLILNSNHDNQVAIITPTTLLARQHFQNIEKRFLPFNIKTANLSRLSDKKEIAEIKNKISTGNIRLIIGTHAILNTEFKNLQLAIIDEEQLFGVKQKEKLKKLYEKIHILSLSATPIPRTLQMSLSGIRDLSIISTPPINRISPILNIIKLDAYLIKEAIIREYRRGGKIYYVCPKIQSLDQNIDFLKDILPEEIKIRKAHAEIPNQELCSIMTDFYEGKFHVLVATTIIQNGIDVPSANTMIVQNAHMFGLAQLYQLKGRVGRGKLASYVYLIIPPKITDVAEKRLNTLRSTNNLGCGLNIAMHDIDIRGFGNLVGEKQSGKINEIGVELYNKLLSHALNETVDFEEVKVNIPIDIGIPEEYISDFNTRLKLYRRISEIPIEEMDNFIAEIIDRFGLNIPSEFHNLIQVSKIQKMAAKLSITAIEITKSTIDLIFSKSDKLNLGAILSHITENPSRYSFRKDNQITVNVRQDYVSGLRNAIDEINQLIQMNGSVC